MMEHTSFPKETEVDTERLAQLRFHLESGDYFRLLATVFGFLEESVKECEVGPITLAPVEAELIQSVRKDLFHLHDNYEIKPR